MIDIDSPAGVIGLVEHFGAAEVLALSARLRVVRGGAEHLHDLIVVVLKELDHLGTGYPNDPFAALGVK